MRSCFCPALFLVLAVSTAGLLGAAPAGVDGAVRYRVRFPRPQSHYVRVSATYPTAGASELVLMLPVWTPGSYIAREYARNVEDVRASDPAGKALPIKKVRKNRWAVETGGADAVVLEYAVYGREMGVQTNWVDADFALLQGAATFLTLSDGVPRPHEVTLELPERWAKSLTGLPAAPGGAPHSYRAADFDELVDCPIYAGNPAVHEFEVDGKPHYLVNEGGGGIFDGSRAAEDLAKIVKVQRDFWGGLPYDRYYFLNLLTEAGGGLEHRNSTVLMASRWATRNKKAYLNWLDLASHEFFHTWNVKRLRPVELGPFDYENEVTTKSLWAAEGLTDYYGWLMLRRAGLITAAEYLSGRPRTRPTPGGAATGEIARLQAVPGRRVQPLESASYDAWIKFYRPDENSTNTAVSYYNKGAVVGWLLDAKVRKATDGRKSLDDVMRLAYQRYSGDRGFTPGEFRAVASEVAGVDLAPWFVSALETTDELDYAEALDWFGLRFKGSDPKPGGWLGLVTKDDGGRLVVSQVLRETPGADAGFNVGDEILAIGDDRVRPSNWSDRQSDHRPGEQVSVLVSRRDRLIRLDATFGAEPKKAWTLEVAPGDDPAREARRKAWLGD